MAQKPNTPAELQEAVDAKAKYDTQQDAAAALKIPVSTFQARIRTARKQGYKSAFKREDRVDALVREVQSLEVQLKAAEREKLTNAFVREQIFKLANSPPVMPKWILAPQKSSKSGPGVPCTMWSDWHWGEVVSKSEVNGVNEFNLKIAHARAKTLFETTVDLLRNHTVNPKFPGIVVNLGGDMITGDIHEELTATNEIPVLPTILDLLGVLVDGINLMADSFGNVFLPCVTGNHGRNTRKIQHKQRAYTNFDWLIYQLLDLHFKDDPRVTFYIPDAPDAAYKVYNHRYLLTHGDQFRGGDGIIGPIGPLMRGDNKKRSRNSQVGADYDTMIAGHFHTLMMLPKLIVNGSLKGYDEYAYNGNFSFELPAQALWLTHPELGMTISMPVYVDKVTGVKATEWVSVPRGKA